VRILLVPGSLRAGSTNATALAALVLDGVAFDRYEDLGALPHFNPDDDVDPLPPAVADLRRRIGAADAVVFSTPEYAGTLPGSFKNLLDWTVGGMEVQGKPVGWLNVAAEGRGRGAHDALRTVLGYVGADIVEGACVEVSVPRTGVDDAIRERLLVAVRALVAYGG
jgi:NAD(P)H-dependent FMN reductase